MELLSTMPLAELEAGSQIVLEAIDPVTGLAVAGVTIANVSIYAETTQPQGTIALAPPVAGFAPT